MTVVIESHLQQKEVIIGFGVSNAAGEGSRRHLMMAKCPTAAGKIWQHPISLLSYCLTSPGKYNRCHLSEPVECSR